MNNVLLAVLYNGPDILVWTLALGVGFYVLAMRRWVSGTVCIGAAALALFRLAAQLFMQFGVQWGTPQYDLIMWLYPLLTLVTALAYALLLLAFFVPESVTEEPLPEP